MFNFIRKYRGFFSLIFVVAAVGMIISMFGSGGTNSGSGGFMNSGSAAEILDERITINEFAQAFNYRWKEAQSVMDKQFQGGQADPQTKAFLEQLLRAQVNPQTVLEGLIQQRFVLAVAREKGLLVAPTAIRYQLEKNPLFQKEGRFDPILYKEYVSLPGEYEKQLEQQLLRDAMFYNFSIPLAVVSKGEMEEAQKLRESFLWELLEVDPSRMNHKIEVSESDIVALLSDAAKETELSAYFEQKRSDYDTPEQVRARHILIRENEGGQKKAEDVRKEIESGKIKFEEAANQYSSDKSNASKGGDLGYFEYASMDENFAKAAFALSKENSLSGVVKSAFGFHVIEFVDRKNAVVKTFEEVKQEIAERFLKETKQKDFALEKLRGVAQENKALSAADLKSLGAEWRKLPAWSMLEDKIGTLATTSLELSEVLKVTEKGQVYPRVIPQGESLFVLRLLSKESKELNQKNVLAERAADSIQTYLDRKLKQLDEKKKIYRNSELIQQFQQQIQSL